mgnify:CR=1 FL=1|tara:strand:- start:345 stop:890 length:546 start_codon:yes stop_codon:yes gene_type:complete
MSNLYNISVDNIDGGQTTLGDHSGKVLLLVNVASQCGLTPQYEGLEALHQKYEKQEFSVLGFPANDFGGQEPGTNEEIKDFCSSNYSVSFPLYSKIPVTGEGKHPLYAHLTSEKPDTEDRDGMEGMLRGHNLEPTAPPEVLWNFEKFLIGKNGEVVRRFAPDTAPDSAKLVDAIEEELAKS